MVLLCHLGWVCVLLWDADARWVAIVGANNSGSSCTYRLEIVQQPWDGSVDTLDSVYRPILSPEIIVQVFAYDHDGNEIDNCSACMAQISLCTDDGENVLDIVTVNGQKTTRALLGDVIKASQFTSVGTSEGCYFVFDDLSVAAEGTFTFRISL
ncbi:hypothetical protein H4R34_001337 [Dimargaris verticillata]|uniref:Velvet domain-containing protein n=1 Tax=Dimargaris verticillata TaxID=2761393 RepID=A0A9W8EB14_9FUNG|nr:hypothetical protein H4R34_001337 [Dimargaris verticillata]